MSRISAMICARLCGMAGATGSTACAVPSASNKASPKIDVRMCPPDATNASAAPGNLRVSVGQGEGHHLVASCRVELGVAAGGADNVMLAFPHEGHGRGLASGGEVAFRDFGAG